MTVFQQFRLWARRAPVGERASSLIGAATVLAVLIWLIAPSGSTNHQTASSFGSGASQGLSAGGAQQAAGVASADGQSATASQSGSGASGNVASSSATVAGSGGASAATGSGAGKGCVSPPGTDQGVTPTQIKVAVALLNAFGAVGNSTFSIPPPQQQQAWYQAAIDNVNASGGVACRKIVPQYFQINDADPSDLQAKCVAIEQAGVFALLDGAYAQFPEHDCFPQNHIPYFGNYAMSAAEAAQFYPYMFDQVTLDELYHSSVVGLKAAGFFDPSNGFKKLGLVYQSCFPTLIDEVMTWMQQVGVSSSSVVKYDLGCPSDQLATPNQLEQAVVTFQGAGVTHVSPVNDIGDFANFTTIAAQQHYYPKYGFGDDGIIGLTYASQHPDYTELANAIAIASSRYGEDRTPGVTPSAGTTRCNAVMQAAKQPYGETAATSGGSPCNEVWMFAAAVDHAPVLQRNALAAGLQAAGSVDFSWPWGPDNFSGSHVTYGGQLWRTSHFVSSCDCWQVPNLAFSPAPS